MNIANSETFEQKLREAETKLGIKPGHGVPIVYDRSLNGPEFIIFLLFVGLLALAYFGRSKAKSPINLDMFVCIVPNFQTDIIIIGISIFKRI